MVANFPYSLNKLGLTLLHSLTEPSEYVVKSTLLCLDLGSNVWMRQRQICSGVSWYC